MRGYIFFRGLASGVAMRPRRTTVLLSVVLLVWLPGMGIAATTINAASVERDSARTRLVLESRSELRFSLYILRHPGRVVLELEGVELNAVLAGLVGQIGADHPYLKPVQIRSSPSGPEAVLLEFGLKEEAEPSIASLKPEAGRGYRLVLDVAPLAPHSASAADSAVREAADQTRPPPMPVPVATVATAPVSASGPVRRADEQNLVLLEVQLDEHVLTDAITTYQTGRETFLPLGELARLLTLAIRTQAEQGTADGYVLSEARGFNLDVAQGRVTLAGQSQLFDRTLVRLQGDDIYVAASLLSRWLPLDFEVDLSSLTLRVKPRERLPLQDRLERERRAGRLGARPGYEDPGYPRVDMPYRLLGVPIIDQTFGMGLRTGNGSRQTSASYTAYLTADLLGLESAFFVSSSRQDPSPDVRFTLARHDPDAGLLGPLRARSVMFGSGVSAPSVTNIAGRSATGQGYGLTLSNRPITQPTSFDRHTLQGDLPPGWDVELYSVSRARGPTAATALTTSRWPMASMNFAWCFTDLWASNGWSGRVFCWSNPAPPPARFITASPSTRTRRAIRARWPSSSGA